MNPRFRFIEVGLVRPLPPPVYRELVDQFLSEGGRSDIFFSRLHDLSITLLHRHTFVRHELNLAFQLKSFRGPSVFDLVFAEVGLNIAVCADVVVRCSSVLVRRNATAHDVRRRSYSSFRPKAWAIS